MRTSAFENRGRLLSSLLLLMLSSAGSALPARAAALPPDAPPDPATAQKLHLRASAAKASFSFQPNVGQADPSSLFVAGGQGYSLQLQRDGVQVVAIQPDDSSRSTSGKPPAFDGAAKAPAAHAESPQTYSNISVRFSGANPLSQVEGLDATRAKSNYLLGNDPSRWRTNVPSYSRVRYRGLYPGIDLIFYGEPQRQLEYDLVVSPGADPNQIHLHIASDRGASIDKDGNLLLDGKSGPVRLMRPTLYQDGAGGKEPVSGAFIKLGKDEFGFVHAAYDRTRPLIIDPKLSLLYSTYAGGIHDDEAFDLTLDRAGNSYLTGEAASQDFPVTGNALQQARKNIGYYVYNAVVMKFDASGDLLFSTFLGGTQNCQGEAIRVDQSGLVYVAGYASSSDFPVSSNALQATYGGGSDAFFAVLSNDGSQLIYSTFLGGAGDENIFRMIQDPRGNLWVAGAASATGLPASAGAYQSAPKGPNTGFAAELTFNQANAQPLTIDALTFLGGSNSYEEGSLYDIALDTTGNVYVGGITESTDFPTTPNALQSASSFTLSGGCYNSSAPNSIGTVSEFSPDLKTLLYSTVLGGKTEDQDGYPVCNQFIHTVHPDGNGNIWAVGITGMQDFPTSTNALSSRLNGNGYAGVDLTVTELTPGPQSTALTYSTYLGGSQFDYGPRAFWDANNNIWIIGTTQSSDFPGVTGASFQAANAGGYDAIITELQPDGTNILYATYLGGSGDEDASNGRAALAFDANSNVYVAGGTGSTNYPLTPSAFQTVFANGDSGPDGYDFYYTVLGGGIIGTASPSSAGNSGDVTVSINGAGFQSGATCSLVLNGVTINSIASTVSSSGNSITCTFNLNGAASGSYNITVTNPANGGTFTRANGLTVTSGGQPAVWANIVGRPIIRTGVPSTITVNYGNSGNVDAYMTHLVVNLPASIQASYTVSVPPTLGSGVSVPTSYNSNGQTAIDLLLPRLPAGGSGSFPIALTDPTNNDQFNLSAAIAEPWFTSAADATSALSTASTSFTPGETTCSSPTHAVTNCLNAYLSNLTSIGATTSQARAIAGTMLTVLQQSETYNYEPQIFGDNLTTAPTGPVAGTLVLSGIPSYDTQITYHVQGASSSNLLDISTLSCTSYAANTNDSLGGTLVRCTIPNVTAPVGTNAIIAGGSLGLGQSTPLLPVLDGCFTVLQDNVQAGFSASATETTSTCNMNAESGEDPDKIPPVPDGTIITIGGDEELPAPPGVIFALPFFVDDPNFPGTSGGSIDPNGKSGTMGDRSASQYVRGSVPLPYYVYFENEPTATLPAANVVVTDQLDPAKVDLTTVSLGSITFGTNVISVPSNVNTYSTTYPINSSLEVRIQGSLDQNTGLLQWTFTSIDPSTGLPPTDPTVGFLPPDMDGVEGQGSVSYNVMPLAGQTTGTKITNGATVVFDSNAPISTPIWLNTLDVDAPSSAVTALPPTQPSTGGSASFTVSWSGTDKGSGIASYTIFVSDNGGAFTTFQNAVSATSATFTGQLGHTYAFYSLATDGAGNMEGVKARPDTSTIITGPTVPSTLTTPADNSTLPGSSATFSWTPGVGVTEYQLYIGTTVGGDQIFRTPATEETSVLATGLPTNGETVYARLFSRINNAWQVIDYTFTAAPATLSTLTAPANNSTLPGSSATFSWTTGSGVTEYQLYIGTTVGGDQIFRTPATEETSVLATGLPTNGETVYARLFSRVNNAWQVIDYTFTAASGSPIIVADKPRAKP